MSKRPTPECDSAKRQYRLIQHDGYSDTVVFACPIDVAERIERDRDELREALYQRNEDIAVAADRIDELKKRAAHWCDLHTVASNERDKLRVEVERLKAELINAYEPETRDDHDL